MTVAGAEQCIPQYPCHSVDVGTVVVVKSIRTDSTTETTRGSSLPLSVRAVASGCPAARKWTA